VCTVSKEDGKRENGVVLRKKGDEKGEEGIQ